MSERPPSEPDDLAPWADDDLVRALRAPGSAAELADQERYVAAFRQAGRSNVRSLPRRAVGRLGAGGTAVVVTVALTSGVAAAYTGHLPDPVQRMMHSVVSSVPAPGSPGPGHPEAGGSSQGGNPSHGPTGPSSAPTTGTGSTASATPSTVSPSTPGSTRTSTGPTSSPTTGTTGPTTPPGSPTGAAPAAMTMAGDSHLVPLGQTFPLSGVVTDATGAPLASVEVVLQVRGPRHWRPVVQATTDSSGVAAATTPAIARSARFRWHAGPGVHSSPWLLRMVPTLTVTAQVDGSTTTITPQAQGSRPGDRIQVLRRMAGRTTPVRRARLDASGTAVVPVVTPRRRAAYVVVLLPTKRHAVAKARVGVVPPPPTAVSISGSASRVASGTSVMVSGTVTSATGAVLPGHRVVLLQRGPVRWRQVGHAVSDSAGHVSIVTPPIAATSRYRLRTDHGAHSTVWRVVEQPSVSASGEREGTSTVVSVSTSGARPGDKVLLFRRVGGRLVRMGHAALDADGSVTFTVKARPGRTAYVVRLVATRKHGPASATAVVPKA